MELVNCYESGDLARSVDLDLAFDLSTTTLASHRFCAVGDPNAKTPMAYQAMGVLIVPLEACSLFSTADR